MTTYLVTGGAGFVGSCLVDALSNEKDNRVIVVDNLLTGSKDNINESTNVILEITDANDREKLEAIFNKYTPDFVFHYAAVVGVTRTLENPLMVLDDIKGFENTLELSVKFKVKRVFFSSSSEVYGEPVEIPLNEETSPLNAQLPYAVVKNIGECYFKSYQKVHGLPFTIFRFFNTYGPKQSADFVMSKFIRSALKNEPITVYGDGSQSRTFGYIDDNIEATLNALKSEESVNQIYNLGNENQITILELAKLVKKCTGSASEIKHLPALVEGDMKRRQPDSTKMKALLGRELTDIEVGIKQVIEQLAKG